MAEDWNQRDWDEPPPLELPTALALVNRLPRPAQGVLLLVWWLVAGLGYGAVGMSAFPAALTALMALVALFGFILLALWIRRQAWRDAEREDLWRLAGWGSVAGAVLFSLPALVFPLLVIFISAIYWVIVLPLQLLR
jgi:hypothetical protein